MHSSNIDSWLGKYIQVNVKKSKNDNECDLFLWLFHGVKVSSNEPKLMSQNQLFCNSCYICLCGAFLMACESWKVVLSE
jgi:hypothetical protein